MKVFAIRSLMVVLALALAACSSSQSTSGSDRSGSNERSAGIDVGGALGSLSYSPGKAGFAYKSTYVNPQEFDTWVKEFKPQIEQALNALAPGFKLQVTGHSDAVGPRDADGSGRKGNIWYSTERARGVYDALVNAGLPKDKMTYRGVANDEPVPGEARDSQKHRRVTFKIVRG